MMPCLQKEAHAAKLNKRKAAPLSSVISIFTTMCPPILHFQVNRPFWFLQTLSPLPLTDLVTSLTGIFTKKLMTSSCPSPPVLLSIPIISLSWFSSKSSSLHPTQCLSRPGTAQPWTITPSDPIFRPDHWALSSSVGLTCTAPSD